MSATNHTVDPKFTYRDKRSGKDVVLYQGLLDAAHRAGLVYIETTILQFPCAENDQTCIVKATVTLSDPDQPRVFSAIGDANPRNVGANIAPHFIRMAETRAKARALRDILNVGTVSVEELDGDEDAAPQHATPPRDQSRRSGTAPTDLRPAAALTAAGTPYKSPYSPGKPPENKYPDLRWEGFKHWAQPLGYDTRAKCETVIKQDTTAWLPGELRTAMEMKGVDGSGEATA